MVLQRDVWGLHSSLTGVLPEGTVPARAGVSG